MSTKQILVNENGLRVGESNPNAKLLDADVERMRAMYEKGASSKDISKIFTGISLRQVHNICTYRSRNQIMVSEQRKK